MIVISHILHCYGNQSETSIAPLFFLIDFMFGIEVSWDNRHQPHTLLLW